MKTYHLTRTQFLPISQAEAWDFFSSPRNLSVITPAHMNFEILSISGGEKMFSGQVIKYKVNVLPYIRTGWITKITDVQEPDYFIDTQLSGPFALWHHKHIYKSVPGGIEMIDELDYAIPLGPLGQIAKWLFVGQHVNAIFEYRNKVLQTYFQKKS
ncbi:MAG: SRPBCC family protein [Cyclobacteriaceae bacterium]|nr:SRPBCC family protein [Cyclobacteriaceae bacterium]